eukprot:TRINITY_DN11092_c0_g1_i1.p1 TRINITY_DN11092_c0_g1~~TRINITY_DN11092_c0_g1_i1.p1  ORF type:complete len:464 (-),score=44.44 TRINITY_DN11092_c0_g1_i1:233-1624(-)
MVLEIRRLRRRGNSNVPSSAKVELGDNSSHILFFPSVKMQGIVSPRACISQTKNKMSSVFVKNKQMSAIRTMACGDPCKVKDVRVVGCNDEFFRKLKALKKSSVPMPPLRNRHIETIFAAFFRTLPNVRFRRECLRMSDNGTVALDWPVSGEDDIWSIQLPFDSPILILLPGLTGGSDDTYVRHMLLRARKHGWRPVVFNMRGCANIPVTTPKFYSASFTGDLQHVIQHISNIFPESNVYAVGWSLGANILVRYLGEERSDCLLSGAVSLCNPFHLPVADEDIQKGFNDVYNRALAKALSRIFRRHLRLFEGIEGEYDLSLAANAKSIREFDAGLTRVCFGFNSVDEYYTNSSSSLSIKHVHKPLLCIQAENDPIAPSRAIPEEEIKENSNCLLVVTPYGGHLGWVSGAEAPFGAPWPDPLVIEFLEVLEKGYAREIPKSEMNGLHSPVFASSHIPTISTKSI